MPNKKTVRRAVVVPTFNEPDTWLITCKGLMADFDLIVVVDDGSQVPIADPLVEGLVLLRHDRNLGKGVALQTGFHFCLAKGADWIATIDSDGEHDPRNFKDALKASEACDLVTLSRHQFFKNYAAVRRFRNVLLSRFLLRKFGCHLQDTQSGMRLFSARAIRCCLREGMPNGYAVETAMLKAVQAQGWDVLEIPMTFEGRIRYGKKYSGLWNCVADIMTFGRLVFCRHSRKCRPN